MEMIENSDEFSYGWLDDEQIAAIFRHGKIMICSKQHLNSPCAKVCWKCGEILSADNLHSRENDPNFWRFAPSDLWRFKNR